MSEDISDFVPFLQYYLHTDATITGLVGGKIETDDDNLDVGSLLLSANNSTETCIIIRELQKNEYPTTGCQAHGRIKYDITIEMDVRSWKSRAYLKTVADKINHFLIKGIGGTDYDNRTYWLRVISIANKTIKEPEAPKRHVMTLRGDGYYQS